MIQQSRKVIQLLADCQYEEAVLDLERMLMDKQTVDTAWMDQIPDLYKQNAPMLLKYQGELWLRQGKLSQAESVFRAAAQGFATQTFQTMLLDVLAYLAVLHMRIGQWLEARSLLLFLNGECNRRGMPGERTCAACVGSWSSFTARRGSVSFSFYGSMEPFY
ncbi:hypothetical protein ACHHV8_35785 [Paenibacillus sp. TAB 01]|uniref:hypothetical protein n=1 Tax=Paenibacillus sp. TAB 01 TaxID=3368988 RepID=UPI003752AF94